MRVFRVAAVIPYPDGTYHEQGRPLTVRAKHPRRSRQIFARACGRIALPTIVRPVSHAPHRGLREAVLP